MCPRSSTEKYVWYIETVKPCMRILSTLRLKVGLRMTRANNIGRQNQSFEPIFRGKYQMVNKTFRGVGQLTTTL